MEDTAAGTEADLKAITPSGKAGLSGGVVIVAGGLSALLGFQTLDILRGASPVVVGGGLLALGLANVVLGWSVRKGRGWAAAAAFGLAAVATVGALIWSVMLILHGFLSVLSCLLVPVNVLASAAAFAQIAPGKRADEARARLEEQGLDIGA